MKVLPSQFTANNFSGAVATPTCSSSCCCCCCCLTTLSAGSVIAANGVIKQAKKNRVSAVRRRSAINIVTLALPVVVIAFLVFVANVPVLPAITVFVAFLALWGLYTWVFKLVKAKDASLKGVKYAVIMSLALVAEFIGGGALILTGSVLLYFMLAGVISWWLIVVTLRNKKIKWPKIPGYQ